MAPGVLYPDFSCVILGSADNVMIEDEGPQIHTPNRDSGFKLGVLLQTDYSRFDGFYAKIAP